jgi:hypothetical protein
VVLAGLCAYLSEKLRVMSASAKSQRTMVCTWLCELLLQRIAALELKASPHPSSSSLAKPQPQGSDDLEDLINQFKDFIRANKYVPWLIPTHFDHTVGMCCHSIL